MGKSHVGFFAFLIRRLLGLMLFLISLMCVPVLVVIGIPLYCIRKLISFLGPRLRPNFGKMLTAQSSLTATDEINTNPDCVVLAVGTLKGILCVDRIRDKTKSIIGIRNVNGQPKNIELTQYPSKWMGYYFWKADTNFDITNHIYYHTLGRGNSRVSEAELREFENILIRKPFLPNRSPWEVIVVKNVESDNDDEICSKLYLRFHHSIGDGYSIWKMFIFDILGDANRANDIPIPKFPTLPFLKKAFLFFRLCTTSLYSFIQYTVDCYDVNDWRMPRKLISNEYINSVSQKITLRNLNGIKHSHGVGLTAVIYAGVTAVIRKAMLEANGRIPDTIHSLVPLPMPGHPDKLRNHVIVIMIPLPVGEVDSAKRLNIIQNNIDRLKNTTHGFVSFYLRILIGGLPVFLMKPIANMDTFTTIDGSSLPGPKTVETFLGHECTDIYFLAGPYAKNNVVVFSSLTYANNLRFVLGVNNSILRTSAEVDKVLNTFEEEFNILRNNIQV